MATATSDSDGIEQRTYDVDGDPVTFEIRGLDADEREHVEEIANREYRKAMIRSRNRNRPRDMNEWAVISQLLEYGLVDATLSGFDPTDADALEALPADVADALFEEIDALTDAPDDGLDEALSGEHLEGI